jgi:hypothetical protein
MENISLKDIENLVRANKMYYEKLTKVEESREEDKLQLPMYIPSENEMKIINTYKENLPQLSAYLVFVLSSLLGGISVMLVNPKSSGKTKIMKTIYESKIFSNYRYYDKVNKELLKKELKSGDNIIMAVDDLAHITGSNLEDLSTFTILASLINNNRYSDEELKLENVKLTLVCGVECGVAEKIFLTSLWKGMVEDRIIRLPILYFKRKEPKRVLADNEVIKLPPLEISSYAEFDDDLDIKDLVNIMACQISVERCYNIVKNILIGHARLRNDNKVTEADLTWFKLYSLPLSLEPLTYIGEREGGYFAIAHRFLWTVLKFGSIPSNTLSAIIKISDTNLDMLIKKFMKYGITTNKDNIIVTENNESILYLKQLTSIFN